MKLGLSESPMVKKPKPNSVKKKPRNQNQAVIECCEFSDVFA
jgi:hypothetical protein